MSVGVFGWVIYKDGGGLVVVEFQLKSGELVNRLLRDG